MHTDVIDLLKDYVHPNIIEKTPVYFIDLGRCREFSAVLLKGGGFYITFGDIALEAKNKDSAIAGVRMLVEQRINTDMEVREVPDFADMVELVGKHD